MNEQYFHIKITNNPDETLRLIGESFDKENIKEVVDGPNWIKMFLRLKRKNPCMCTEGAHLMSVAEHPSFPHTDYDHTWHHDFKKWWMLKLAQRVQTTSWKVSRWS